MNDEKRKKIGLYLLWHSSGSDRDFIDLWNYCIQKKSCSRQYLIVANTHDAFLLAFEDEDARNKAKNHNEYKSHNNYVCFVGNKAVSFSSIRDDRCPLDIYLLIEMLSALSDMELEEIGVSLGDAYANE